MNPSPNKSAVIQALAAAALFGAGTPIAKYLLGTLDPWLLAGLLYAGSGLGLSAYWLARSSRVPEFNRGDALWLAGAIGAGGIVAPVLLMYGLTHVASSVAALLLNAEGVLTVLLAWAAFREHFDRRIALGMASITLGALVLSWPSGSSVGAAWPSLAIIGACLAWAIDNNLTRRIALADATLLAAMKGLIAGLVNLTLALLLGASLPAPLPAGIAMITGLATYGISLVLFVLALRGLGTARTAAYFSIAPFIGAVIGLLGGEPVTASLLVAAAFMALGIWMHATEAHGHEHLHEPVEHTHSHVHDEHHQHEHKEPVEGGVPHVHAHVHARLRHSHAHFPDAHHRHSH